MCDEDSVQMCMFFAGALLGPFTAVLLTQSRTPHVLGNKSTHDCPQLYDQEDRRPSGEFREDYIDWIARPFQKAESLAKITGVREWVAAHARLRLSGLAT